MNQHRAPAYQILVDGQDISAAIRPRLIGLSLADNRGFEVDTLELSLDDTDGKLALPRRGAQLQALIGWQGSAPVDKGTYTIDEVEHCGAPDVLSLPAHGGDAHRRVCATETVLFRSHLRAAPIKFFAKVDYRKALGPERAR